MHENHLGSITIVDDGSQIAAAGETDGLEAETTEEEIIIATPVPTQEVRETTESTPVPSYSPDTLLLAENQVNGLALQTALTGLFMGFVLAVEVLKIWLTGSR